jgi:RNA polymerase sigma factor (TIGR02999 family)
MLRPFTRLYRKDARIYTLRMSPHPPNAPLPADLTTLLNSWREGDGEAFGAVIERVYDELKRIAASRLRQVGGSATLSPTDLLHEAVIRIMPGEMTFKNRVHFFATVSLVVRSILVDHARARSTEKRGGARVRVTLTDSAIGEDSPAGDLLAIEQALNQLEALDPRCGQVLHLTYFAGLSQEEITELLGISLSTVARDLRFAHSWITKALRDDA